MRIKIIGGLLIVAGMSFLVWKILAYKTEFGMSLLLNISGFLVVSVGFALFKMPESKNKKSKSATIDEPIKSTKVQPKESEDYSRFMPK